MPIKTNKAYQLVSALAITLLFVIVGIYCSLDTVSMTIMISITAFVLVFYLLLFKRELLFQLNLLLLPLSMELELFNTAKVNFPSEVVTLLVFVISFPFFIYHFKEYSKILRHPFTVVLLVGVLWMFITSLLSDMPAVGLKRTVVRILYMFVYYFITYKYIKDDISKGIKFLFLYSIGLILPAIISIVFMAKFNFISAAAYMAGFPYFKDHTIYGAVVAFVFTFLLILKLSRFKYKESKLLDYILSILVLFFLVSLFLSFSRAAWVSLVAALMAVFLFKMNIKLNRIYMVVGTIAIVIAMNWTPLYDWMKKNDNESSSKDITEHAQSVTNLNKDASNMERINRWVCAIRMFNEKPIAGFGPGTYQFYYGEYQTRDYMTHISTFSGNKGHAHSEYLGALSEQGIPGFILFIISIHLVLNICSKLILSFNTSQPDKRIVLALLAALITFFAHSIFNGFMDTDKIACLVFISFAIIISLDIKYKKMSTEDRNSNILNE